MVFWRWIPTPIFWSVKALQFSHSEFNVRRSRTGGLRQRQLRVFNDRRESQQGTRDERKYLDRGECQRGERNKCAGAATTGVGYFGRAETRGG